MAYSILSYSK